MHSLGTWALAVIYAGFYYFDNRCFWCVCRYVGKCEGLPKGFWVGIQYDEPVGKNNGFVRGTKYFECPDGYGSMVRPNLVKIGDYPPLDEFEFSDEDEI